MLNIGKRSFLFSKKSSAVETFYIGGQFSSASDDETPPSITANRIAMWNGTQWSSLGSGMNSIVRGIRISPSGVLHAAGNFTTANGVTVNRIARWNGTQWSGFGSGLNSTSYNFAWDSSENLYVGGGFTTANGVTANRIAKWNGTQFSSLGTGMNNSVINITIDSFGTLYACGSFTTAGGVTVNNIAKWNGSSWSSLGTGMGGGTFNINTAFAMALDSSNNLYVGGSFKTANGVTVNGIAKWNVTTETWSAVGTGVGVSSGSAITYVSSIAIDSSDNLYIGGNFTSIDGVVANRVAKWNGSAWSTFGTGFDNLGGILLDSSENIYAFGSYTQRGDGYLISRLAKWNGIEWERVGGGLNSNVRFAVFDSSDNLYLGGDFTTVYNSSYFKFVSYRNNILSETPQ